MFNLFKKTNAYSVPKPRCLTTPSSSEIANLRAKIASGAKLTDEEQHRVNFIVGAFGIGTLIG